MYKRPDLSHSIITALFQTQQNSDELAEGFMDRLHGIAHLGFRHLPDDEKQEILVTAFCKGLHDRVSARLVATQAHGRVAEAIRIASAAHCFDEGEKFVPSQPSGRPHASRPQHRRHDRVFYAGTQDTAEELNPYDPQFGETDEDLEYFDKDDEFETATDDENSEEFALMGPQR